MTKSLPKAILPLLIVGATVAIAAFMLANRVTPERLAVEERSTPVEIIEVEAGQHQVVVKAQGTVTAAQEVQLRPEVSGRIVSRSPDLVPGGQFQAGETIAHIDDRDYRAQLAAARETLARARLVLRQEEAQQAVAREEWEILGESALGEGSNRDLALREPQIEQAEAAVAAAESAVAKAETDLERCVLKAPFDALVIREQVDTGQFVSPQTEVATLVGTDAYWVQVSLPVEDLQWIDIPGFGARQGASATVTSAAAAVTIQRQARVERLLGDVDPAGRLARILLVIDDPRSVGAGSELPLLLGSYVNVEIVGRTIEDAVAIPRRALREIHRDGVEGAREGLWIMDADDRLAIREVEVMRRSRETIILAEGLAEGGRLVTSAIATPIEGMKLRTAGISSGQSK